MLNPPYVHDKFYTSPLVVSYYPIDSDRDGVGDDCDPFPADASDGGASHRHDVCVASTVVVGSPPPGPPPAFDCPSGPDLPVPPVLDMYPESMLDAVGRVLSLWVSLYQAFPYEPIPAATVSFTVSGANTASGACLTDNYGGCSFNYLGANLGIDTIEATATVDGASASDTVTMEWVLPPANDDFAEAVAAPGLPFSDSRLFAGASMEAGEPHSCGYPDGTVWYSFTPDEDVFVRARTLGDFFASAIAAYTGDSLSTLQMVGCGQPFYGPGPPPPKDAPSSVSPHNGYFPETSLFVALSGGVTYHFQVGGYPGPGDLVFNIDRATPADADCDGTVDSVDALSVLRYVAFLGFAECIGAADIDCDLDIDAVDALLVLRHVASLPLTLPPGCPDLL